MDKKNFNKNMLLNKKFGTQLSGYSPDEVDTYLDKIIADYNSYEIEVEILNDKLLEKISVIEVKENEIQKFKMKIQNLEEQQKSFSASPLDPETIELLKNLKNLSKNTK